MAHVMPSNNIGSVGKAIGMFIISGTQQQRR